MLLLTVAASTQAASMKLLTRGTGWFLAGSGLMWTADDGARWRDITPQLSSGEHVASVFFLNGRRGWALLSASGSGSTGLRIMLASTDSSGATWSLTRVSVPGLNPRLPILAGTGEIDFLDATHGWLNLDMVSSSNFRSAILPETYDGGRTWSRPPGSPGVGGELRFVTPTDGWLAGGPGGERLYVTHDASQTWQRVSLKPPS